MSRHLHNPDIIAVTLKVDITPEDLALLKERDKATDSPFWLQVEEAEPTITDVEYSREDSDSCYILITTSQILDHQRVVWLADVTLQDYLS